VPSDAPDREVAEESTEAGEDKLVLADIADELVPLPLPSIARMIAFAIFSGDLIVGAPAVDAPFGLAEVSGSPDSDVPGRVIRWINETKAENVVSGFVVRIEVAPGKAGHAPRSLRPERTGLDVPLAISNVLADATTFTNR
jgi:hypothetical protein